MSSRLVYLRDVVTLRIDAESCSGCGSCVTVCPHGVLALARKKVVINDRDHCMECGACATNCPTGAVTVDSGVGCAAAVSNAALGRTDAECCCVGE